MTNPRDDEQFAPRRPLTRTGNADVAAPVPASSMGAPTQQIAAAPTVASPPYGGAPQQAPAAPPVDRDIATPPAPEAAALATRHSPPGQPTGQQEPSSRRANSSRARTMRRAKLRLLRVDPWSVTKSAFLLSIAFGIMCVVAVFLVFSIMSASGLWDSVNETIQGVLNQEPDEAFDIKDYVAMDRIMAITMLIAAVDVVLITALATLGAFIYNMAASLLGGVEVTLAEDVK